MLMRTVDQYYGPNGERLEELTLVDVSTKAIAGEAQIKAELSEPEPVTVFLGMLVIPVAIQGPKGDAIGVRPQEMRFPIEATSRQEAFEKYQAAAQQAIEQLKADQAERQKQASKPELVVPNAAQSEAINKLKLVRD